MHVASRPPGNAPIVSLHLGHSWSGNPNMLISQDRSIDFNSSNL
jgi:hypothetical protein